MKDIWVLVADGGRARIFSTSSSQGELTELEAFTQPQIRMTGRQVRTDRPGRTFDIGGQGHHAMEYSSSYKDQAREEFARELVQHLEQGYQSGKFDKLVLVSEPSFLGYLRRNISSHLQAAVSCEVDKNLTRLPPDRLRQQLPERLASSLA